MPAPKTSPDKGKSVQWYFDEKMSEPWQKVAAETLHVWILSIEPEVKHGIKWAQPVYENEDGPFAFIRSAKHHLTFGLWRGHALSDPDGLLTGEGEKMKHLKIKSPEMPEKQIKEWIAESLRLNRELGNPTK